MFNLDYYFTRKRYLTQEFQGNMNIHSFTRITFTIQVITHLKLGCCNSSQDPPYIVAEGDFFKKKKRE